MHHTLSCDCHSRTNAVLYTAAEGLLKRKKHPATNRSQFVDGIVSDWENLKLFEWVDVVNHLNTIVEQNEILEFDKRWQAFNLLYVVER